MRFLLTLLTTTLITTAAVAHPGMGDSAAHATMHSLGGTELILASLVAGFVAWFAHRRLRSASIRRK